VPYIADVSLTSKGNEYNEDIIGVSEAVLNADGVTPIVGDTITIRIKSFENTILAAGTWNIVNPGIDFTTTAPDSGDTGSGTYTRPDGEQLGWTDWLSAMADMSWTCSYATVAGLMIWANWDRMNSSFANGMRMGYIDYITFANQKYLSYKFEVEIGNATGNIIYKYLSSPQFARGKLMRVLSFDISSNGELWLGDTTGLYWGFIDDEVKNWYPIAVGEIASTSEIIPEGLRNNDVGAFAHPSCVTMDQYFQVTINPGLIYRHGISPCVVTSPATEIAAANANNDMLVQIEPTNSGGSFIGNYFDVTHVDPDPTTGSPLQTDCLKALFLQTRNASLRVNGRPY
jgi:hypothetical protein